MTNSHAFRFQPGDILLFNGNGWLSKAIRFFDGADVNHAALAVDGTTMIEAAGEGLRNRPISDAIATNNFTNVLRLPDANDLARVVNKGEGFLKERTPYAYQQIFLLAILSITRHVDIRSRILRRVVRTACDFAARLINAIIDRKGKTMICSEFVFRAYQESGDERFELTRHDDWRTTIVTLAVGQERAVVAGWARQRQEPARPAARAAAADDPQAIAAEAQTALEPLLSALLREEGAVDDLQAPAAKATAAAVPETSDDELHLAALGLRDALHRAASAGVTSGAIQAESVGDLWGWFERYTDADFVTPGDLEHMTPVASVATLPATP